MKVLVTGSSNGIGLAIAEMFLDKGHEVHGIDREDSAIYHPNYTHHVYNINGCPYSVEQSMLPDIEDVEILVNNAGVQNTQDDIGVNLRGLINCTLKYGIQPAIKSIMNIGSASAHHGAEFPEYVASKGGVLSFTRWAAKEVYKYGATCNSLSPGGVITQLNQCVIDDKKLWNQIMDLTPLKKWASAEEIAEWVYFMTVVNKSCTGQDILIDNGEFYAHTFIWE